MQIIDLTEEIAPTFDVFYLFPKLPIEIRSNIWDEASSVPRIVRMLVLESQTPKAGRKITYSSATPVPAVLHSTRESRQHALQHYQLSFGCLMDTILGKASTVYLNLSQDIVYFPSRSSITDSGMSTIHSLEHLYYSFATKSITKLRKVALPIHHATSQNATLSVMALYHLPKLAEIILVGCEELIDDNTSQVIAPVKITRYDHSVYFSDPEESDLSDWKEMANILDESFKNWAKAHPGRKHPKPRMTLKVLCKDAISG